MIQVEPIQNLNGFGAGLSQGEYFYSQGMCRTLYGLTPDWYSYKTADNSSGSLGSGLGLINWFSCNGASVFAIDKNGLVYSSPNIPISWAQTYSPLDTGGNGMIVDQTGRVLVAGNRYLSKWDGATAPVTTGDVSLTNSSTSVTGVGTSFTSAMVGKQIVFASQPTAVYTIASVASGTSLTLNTAYTGTAGSSPYVIYMGSTEQWQDLGAGFTTGALRVMELFEDQVMIANGPGISALNVTDDSFGNNQLLLSTGYTVTAMKSGLSGLLVGVNANGKGAIFLWDGQAPGPISQWIWFNAEITAIVTSNEGFYGYYVITTRGIFLTNGYLVQPVFEQMPDDRVNYSSLLPSQANSVVLIGNYLIFLGGGYLNRQRQGIYMFNLQTRLLEFCPVSNNVQWNLEFGAIYYDNSFNIHLSYNSLHPVLTAIAQLFNTPPTSAYFITDPKGLGDGQNSLAGNDKIAEAAKFTILENTRAVGPQTLTYGLALKIYNFKRPLWNYAETITGTANYTQFTINGTVNTGNQVGDEVTFLEGANAGTVAHISAITNQGTLAETWTLNTTLANVPESGIKVSVTPFLLAATFSLSSVSQLRDVYFDIASKYRGKRFLLKLLITNPNGLELDITDGQFLYTDQGIITS